MNLYIRLIWVVLKSIFSSRMGLLETSTQSFRVLPNDLDIQGHMNNGRYHAIADICNIRFGIRNRSLILSLRNRYLNLVKHSHIAFFKSLSLFERYEVKSRILCWDEEGFYVEHLFIRSGNDDIVAKIVFKGVLLSKHGKVSSQKAIDLYGEHSLRSPEFPDVVVALKEQELQMRKSVKKFRASGKVKEKEKAEAKAA